MLRFFFCASVNNFVTKGEGDMSFKKKQSVRSGDPAAAIAIGAVAALILSIALCAVITGVVSSGNTDIQSVGIWIYAVQGVCCFLGAMAGAIVAAGKRMQVCLLTALAYFLCLLAMTALLFGGQYSGVIMSAMMVMLGGLAAGLLGIRTKKGMKIKGIKRSYR